MDLLLLQVLCLAILFIMSAFFSAAESAYLSLNPIQIYRIRNAHPKACARIERILAHPTDLLSSVLVGNTLVNVAIGALGYSVLERLLPKHGVATAIPVMTVLLLILGEVTPKRLALHFPERLAILLAAPLEVLNTLMTPARIILSWPTRLMHRWFTPQSQRITGAELLTAIGESEQRGILDRDERLMLDGILRLGEIHARDVMTPRVDLIALNVEDNEPTIAQTARRVRYKYLPVYRKTVDQIEGFLNIPGYLLSEHPSIHAALIPPYFVPETMPLDKILSHFLANKQRIACVVDEFGGTAGVLTQGDIMEEIAAGVENEYGPERPPIEPMGDCRWLIPGSANLEEVNYVTGLNLSAEGSGRIGGWVLAHLERLPHAGDRVEAQGCIATVRQVRRLRILSVLLETPAGECPEKGREAP